ncbi:MAG: response regulator transcription factor [Burkholderiaceae bacterium]
MTDKQQGPTTRILILQAEPLLSIGLVTALRQQADFEVHVEGAANSGPSCPIHFDVVIADHGQGVPLAEAIRKGQAERRFRQARVLLITAKDRELDIRVAMEAGVYGYLPSNCPVAELHDCVRRLGAGSRYLSAGAAQRMADSLSYEALTLRESEVLGELARGKCNKLIAAELQISTGTVKAHLKSIYAKLQAASRTEAANIAQQRGLVGGGRVAPQPAPRSRARNGVHLLAEAQSAFG